jgi:hypothetical protein
MLPQEHHRFQMYLTCYLEPEVKLAGEEKLECYIVGYKLGAIRDFPIAGGEVAASAAQLLPDVHRQLQ